MQILLGENVNTKCRDVSATFEIAFRALKKRPLPNKERSQPAKENKAQYQKGNFAVIELTGREEHNVRQGPIALPFAFAPLV